MDIRLQTHSMGLRRINEVRSIAQRRLNFSRKGRFNADGSIKVLGEYDLGKKGGTYTDKEPIMVLKPGRESTPPRFNGLTPKRSHPGTLSAQQFFVTVRRQCEGLSKQQRQAVFAQFEAHPLTRNGTLDETPTQSPTPSPQITQVRTQIGRLSYAERENLFKEFHFGIKLNANQGCGARHQQRAKTAAGVEPLGRTVGFGRTRSSLGNTRASLARAPQHDEYEPEYTDQKHYGYDDLFPESAAATQQIGTPAFGATQNMRATHQSLAATSRSLRATGQLVGMEEQTLLCGKEKDFIQPGRNQKLHGEPNLPTGLDYGNMAHRVVGAGTVQLPVTVCSTHGFSRKPSGGFYKPNKSKLPKNAAVCEVRQNPRVVALLARGVQGAPLGP